MLNRRHTLKRLAGAAASIALALIAGLGCGEPPPEPTPTPAPVPESPTEVLAHARLWGNHISWKPVAGASHYRVYWRESGGSHDSALQMLGDALQSAIEDPKEPGNMVVAPRVYGTAYYHRRKTGTMKYSVAACNAHGCGEQTGVEFGTGTVLGPCRTGMSLALGEGCLISETGQGVFFVTRNSSWTANWGCTTDGTSQSCNNAPTNLGPDLWARQEGAEYELTETEHGGPRETPTPQPTYTPVPRPR